MVENNDRNGRTLSTLVCESLPFNIAIFRDGDECAAKESSCEYCSHDYRCTKDTYIRDDLFKYA